MKREPSRFEDAVLPQSEQSTLEQFARHSLPHRPNELHEIGRWTQQREKRKSARQEKIRAGGGENCISPSARAARAEREGSLHGALWYTHTENATGDAKRVEESDETVVSRMNSKEQFPQG